jgi:hypothetical protein
MNKKSQNGKRKEPNNNRSQRLTLSIAHPDNQALFEQQFCSVYIWLCEMLDRLKAGDDAKAASSARKALEPVFLKLASELLGLALVKNNTVTKQWAGRLLATIACSVRKYHKKLSKINSAYRQEKAKIGKLRADVWFAEGVRRIAQRELKTAEDMRRRLLVLKQAVKKDFGRKWKKEWPKVIQAWTDAQPSDVATTHKRRLRPRPQEYLPAMESSEFSGESEPKWWKFLWPRIRNKINVAKLDSRYRIARKTFCF